MNTRSRVLSAFALMLIVGANPARAGGWISGGTGELAADSGNPWFLDLPEQPKSISYCIDADLDAMGVAQKDLNLAVFMAVRYWQGQIGAAPTIETAGAPAVRIRTANFVDTGVACHDDDGTDLQFQFGRLATAEQKTLVETQHLNLKHFIGFAARTSYDATMRGRGFIYIAPQAGSMRPEGERLLTAFWSDPNPFRLFAVVQHELGHVFGVPHFGDETSLMGEAFPEHLVTVADLGQALDRAFITSTFRAGDGDRFLRCLDTQPTPLAAWPTLLTHALRLGADDKCLRFAFSANGMSIYARSQDDLPWRQIAAFTPTDGSIRERIHEIVRIWLPEARTVLTGVPASTHVLRGPAVVETMMAGHLRTDDASSLATLTLDPASFQLGAVVDGAFAPNLFDGLDDNWRPIGRR